MRPSAELGVGVRTIKQWVSLFRSDGEAGLAPKPSMRRGVVGNSDERWVETALEVMVEHVDQSRPSRTMVIARTNARVAARFGEGVVRMRRGRRRFGFSSNWSGGNRRSG